MFEACPLLKIRPLPFAIDEIDFSVWFKSLATTDTLRCCEELLHVLKALNKLTISSNTRLFFLEKLGPVLFHLADRSIPASFSHSPSLAIADSPGIEIAVWACSELANGYARLSTEEDFKKTTYYSVLQKSLIISRGLQAMGKTLLYISQTYRKPYANFWLNCFKFYRLARHYNLTEDAAGSEAQLINNVFKHILVFSLSKPNQFSPEEMRVVYDLLSQYSEHAKLLPVVPEKKFKGIPYVYLKDDLPPAIPNSATPKEDENTLYIATVGVAGKILEATSDKNLNSCPADRLMLLRLAKTLTMNLQRKHARVKAAGKQFGIIGFDDVIYYLRNKTLKTEQSSAKGLINLNRPGGLRELNLEIINPEQKSANPREYSYRSEKLTSDLTYDMPGKITKIGHEDIWHTEKKEVFEANIKLIDKSEKGYGLVLENTRIQPRIGDIVGLQNKDASFSIGVIRRFAQSGDSGLFAGVELFGVNPQFIEISNPGYCNDIEAIYLPGEETESIILVNNEFRPAEFIFVHKAFKKTRYRLTKQLTATALINQFAVVKA
ncbi:MAG: hypothetical protein PHY16_12490 [Methylobacter sp.]|nr:hypothetical protein [Methylobacter sp.]